MEIAGQPVPIERISTTALLTVREIATLLRVWSRRRPSHSRGQDRSRGRDRLGPRMERGGDCVARPVTSASLRNYVANMAQYQREDLACSSRSFARTRQAISAYARKTERP